jgi:hypothetical protein
MTDIALNNKKFCIVVYLDIEGAYDGVWHQGLLYEMKRMGFKDQMLVWMSNYLKERTMKVRVGSNMSEEVVLSRGVPQGAALSPILFNIMVSDVPQCQNVEMAAYADDITLWANTRRD